MTERELLEHAWEQLRRDRQCNAARRAFRTAFERTHGTEWWYLAPVHERLIES